jgi:hypothetical protein
MFCLTFLWMSVKTSLHKEEVDTIVYFDQVFGFFEHYCRSIWFINKPSNFEQISQNHFILGEINILNKRGYQCDGGIWDARIQEKQPENKIIFKAVHKQSIVHQHFK